MIANNINGTIKTFNKLPNSFNRTIGGYSKLDSSVHYADGFRDIVYPTLQENEYKTNLYFDSENDVFTYNVEIKSEVELERELDAKVLRYGDAIKRHFSELYTRSLSSSMNKDSKDINFLLGIKEEYSDKYKVSKGILTEGVLYENTLESINTEMQDEFNEEKVDELLTSFGIGIEGTHLEKMFLVKKKTRMI